MITKLEAQKKIQNLKKLAMFASLETSGKIGELIRQYENIGALTEDIVVISSVNNNNDDNNKFSVQGILVGVGIEITC